MIPKNIFFIWIGQKPAYLNFTLQKYKEYNKDCNIQLIYYSNNQLENLFFKKLIFNNFDSIVYNLLTEILDNNAYYELISTLMNGELHINHSYTPFILIFCDVLRLELINIFGGIYVDCDTFPIKAFDDLLFSHNKFCVYDKINNSLVPNNYFFGSDGKTKWTNYFDNTAEKIILINNQLFTKINKNKSFDFMVRRIKFFKCKLTKKDFVNINNSDYFEHYSEFRWGLHKINLTKFDDIFDKTKYFY